jgi:hypothetical protein
MTTGFFTPLPIRLPLRFAVGDGVYDAPKEWQLTVPANAQQVTRPPARRVKTGRFSTVESDRWVALIAVFEKA